MSTDVIAAREQKSIQWYLILEIHGREMDHPEISRRKHVAARESIDDDRKVTNYLVRM